MHLRLRSGQYKKGTVSGYVEGYVEIGGWRATVVVQNKLVSTEDRESSERRVSGAYRIKVRYILQNVATISTQCSRYDSRDIRLVVHPQK